MRWMRGYIINREKSMNKNKNGKLTSNSQSLRKNMTTEEKRLWYDFLKKLPLNINRQKVIGNYIVDFYCSEKNTVIEIDGSQHYEEDAIYKDKIREDFLKSLGLKIIRYSNYDINRNFEGVCQDILNRFDLLDFRGF